MSEENLPKQPDSTAPNAEIAIVEDPPPLEPNLLEQVVEAASIAAITTVKHEAHSGPMPSPKQYAEYEAILPGTALAIRNEFQANGQHIRTMEDRGQAAAIENDKQSRATAERLVWASLALILILAITNHENVAIAVAVTTVVAVITGFLSNKTDKPNKQPNNEN